MPALNKNQENKLTMYEAVLALFAANDTIIGPVAALVDAKDAFTAVVTQIKTKGQEKADATAGKAQSKAEAKEALALVAAQVAGALYAYARKNNDQELKAVADVTEGQLRRVRDTELASKATTLHTKAAALTVQLGDYNMTPAKIADLQTKITAYTVALGKRETGAAIRTGATAALSTLFEQADETLTEEIDKIMETLRSSNTDFYNQYYAVRVIKDLGIRHEEEEPEPAPPVSPTAPNP